MARREVFLEGRRFGRLLVQHELPKTSATRTWSCICDCGQLAQIRQDCLLNGNTASCGCYKKSRAREANTSHSMSNTPTWRSYFAMKQRCTNPKHRYYANYGGRGIRVCEEWNTFEGFFASMGVRPKGTSLDRIDPNGDYTPTNTRWSDKPTQNRNSRANRRLTLNGVTKCLSEWASELGFKHQTISKRLKLGWSDEETLTRPVR